MSEQEQSTQDPNGSERETVRITPDGVANRPELRPKAVSERQTDTVVPEDVPIAASGSSRKPVRKVTLPSQSGMDGRMTYATHRPPPETGKNTNKGTGQRRTVPPRKAVAPTPAKAAAEKQVSAGFILGVALVVLTLVFGVALVRLSSRVSALEGKVAEAHPDPTSETGE